MQSKSLMRLKIRRFGDIISKVLTFNPDEETLPSLLNKIRMKLDLDNTYNILQLSGGGKIEEVTDLVFDDLVEILSPF